MTRITTAACFLVKNFGPLIAFFVAQHFWGLKVAIAASMVVAVIEIGAVKRRHGKLSLFFKFSVAITLIFGVADLSVATPVFFKFEAALTNILFAFFFAISIFRAKPLIQEFAEQKQSFSDRDPRDIRFFFQLLTGAWAIYFIAKAAIYTFINLSTSVESGLIARAIIGNISFALMLAISIIGGRKIWLALSHFGLMPSQRSQLKHT